jgi:hypothetical protein
VGQWPVILAPANPNGWLALSVPKPTNPFLLKSTKRKKKKKKESTCHSLNYVDLSESSYRSGARSFSFDLLKMKIFRKI